MTSPHGFRDPSPPTRSAIAAAIRLLADEQQEIFVAARDCLRQYGERARAQLNEVAEGGAPIVRVRARELLRSLDVRKLLRRLLALQLDRGSRKPDALLTGAVLSSAMVRTFTPPAPQLSRWLRHEARQVRARIAGRSLPTCARLLSEHLAEVLGFRGHEAGRVELDHALLDRVIARKVGAPVSLSLVWLLVGRWAGLSVSGVGMPDHFLVRLHGRRPVLIDPFHGGRQVTKIDCIRFLRSQGHDRVLEHLRDLSDREVLAHYLRQLRNGAATRVRSDAQDTLRDALFHLEANPS